MGKFKDTLNQARQGLGLKTFKEKEADDLSQQSLDRCLPVAKAILKIIAENDVYLGDLNDDKGEMKENINECYMKVAKQVLDVMLTHNLRYMEREYCFQLAMVAFEQTKDKVMNSLSMSFENCNTKLFGKDFMDVTLSDMDEILQRPEVESFTAEPELPDDAPPVGKDSEGFKNVDGETTIIDGKEHSNLCKGCHLCKKD